MIDIKIDLYYTVIETMFFFFYKLGFMLYSYIYLSVQKHLI